MKYYVGYVMSANGSLQPKYYSKSKELVEIALTSWHDRNTAIRHMTDSSILNLLMSSPTTSVLGLKKL